MCGIVGTWNRRGSAIDCAALERATDLMALRGPDDRGTWVEQGVGLGHRRLSILDLSVAGHQPMVALDRYIIVFNGEIYNFREVRAQLEREVDIHWRTQTDTEVILMAYHQWGPECLQRFSGMFAFCIWDRIGKAMFLARDRLGEKPLYYYDSPGLFAFASRPQAIFAVAPELSRALEHESICVYLQGGYVPSPASIYRELRKLAPAHYMLVSEQGCSIHRYWDYRQIAPEPSWEARKEDDLLDEFDEVVTRSVRSRMVSDAPIGAFLSGGIDSSLVVAKMQKYSPNPSVSLTIGFTDKAFDESGSAAAVARHLETRHFSDKLEVDNLVELVPRYFAEFDEPCFDYSAFPTMAVSRLARKHVTVSLSGDGGDELFGGYHYYQIIQTMSHAYRLPSVARHGIADLTAHVPHNSAKLLAGALRQRDPIDAFAFARSIAKDFDSPLESLGAIGGKPLHALFRAAAEVFPTGLQPTEKAMRLDTFFTLPEDYLTKVDRASMAFSLESREPLLAHELVEWSMRLPLCWKLRGRTNKYLLRKLLYRHVPRRIVDRPKMGFGLPMAAWLRGPLKNWAAERINSRALFDHLPLVQQKVIDLFLLHQSGQRNVAPLLWALLVLLEQQRISSMSGV